MDENDNGFGNPPPSYPTTVTATAGSSGDSGGGSGGGGSSTSSGDDGPSDDGPGGDCSPGDMQACYEGDPATENVGECMAGTQTCDGSGSWGPCEGEIGPVMETCNGADDDCDGNPDNGNPGGGAACSTGLPGPCSTGAMNCNSGQLQCQQTVFSQTEICGDGIDNDCNGTPDNGCTCNPLNPAPVCGAGAHCIPQPAGNTICSGPTGLGTQYSFCVNNADCSAIYECVNTGFNVGCLQWCSSDFDCGVFDFCTPLAPPVFVGAQEWGVCWDGFF